MPRLDRIVIIDNNVTRARQVRGFCNPYGDRIDVMNFDDDLEAQRALYYRILQDIFEKRGRLMTFFNRFALEVGFFDQLMLAESVYKKGSRRVVTTCESSAHVKRILKGQGWDPSLVRHVKTDNCANTLAGLESLF